MKYITFAALTLLTVTFPQCSWAISSTNFPLDSPAYDYLDKLAGFGLLASDLKGLRPYSKAEVARLVMEAEGNLASLDPADAGLAQALLEALREQVAREYRLRGAAAKAPLFDYSLVSYARLRYVYLQGGPRDYGRDVFDAGGSPVFGFIGGNLRPLAPAIVHQSGTEGTPLLENNEGVVYRAHHNGELRWGTEGFIADQISLLVEPLLRSVADGAGGQAEIFSLQKAYLKLGGGGVELEVGRDANWFGPGYRGALTLTDNARNFDSIKLSSPEPIDVGWVKRYLGNVKYALLFSRFNHTGEGVNERQPYFIGAKLAVKPSSWFEIGWNFVRQEGGPGFSGGITVQDLIFGGGTTNKSNSIAGFDLRFRIPWLRDTELYGEYAGEDSATFWPIVESYLAGFYIPRLTTSGKDDLRFEYFWGHQLLYTDWKFPEGYNYYGMTPGHSQGGGAQEFFVRYSHWFAVRNRLALEYFHTDRGKVGKVAGQTTEQKDAGRAFWSFPLYKNFDAALMYGWERIDNLNLAGGVGRDNQLFRFDLSYNY